MVIERFIPILRVEVPSTKRFCCKPPAGTLVAPSPELSRIIAVLVPILSRPLCVRSPLLGSAREYTRQKVSTSAPRPPRLSAIEPATEELNRYSHRSVGLSSCGKIIAKQPVLFKRHTKQLTPRYVVV